MQEEVRLSSAVAKGEAGSSDEAAHVYRAGLHRAYELLQGAVDCQIDFRQKYSKGGLTVEASATMCLNVWGKTYQASQLLQEMGNAQAYNLKRLQIAMAALAEPFHSERFDMRRFEDAACQLSSISYDISTERGQHK